MLRDFSAGLIVAMMAIPLAMGFAMASGLRPEQGIVGGAVAGLVGALFGGSKYQVYGPTAAFIPVIAGLDGQPTRRVYGFDAAHGMLVLASIIAGVILMLDGPGRAGQARQLVPHSIVVGFTIGIAVTIALSQVGEVLGLHAGFKLTEHERSSCDKGVPARSSTSCNRYRPGVRDRSQFLARCAACLATSWRPARIASQEGRAAMPPSFVEKLQVICATWASSTATPCCWRWSRSSSRSTC